MSLTQRLELRQGQTLLMTPQLVQAIKLLQMSHYELQSFVDAEVERNPLLEHAESDDTFSEAQVDTSDTATFEDHHDGDNEGAPTRGTPAVEEWFFSERQPGRGDFEQTFDNAMDNVFPDDNAFDRTTGSSRGIRDAVGAPSGDELPEIGQTLSVEITLREHLLRQLDLATSDPKTRLIGSYLIDEIDSNGYLLTALSEIAQRLNTEEQEIEATLTVIQGFEPTGIGARNLLECLSLQLKERNRFDPAMECLLSRLDLVARRDNAALKKLCRVDDEDIAEMLAEVRQLDPKPCSSFGGDPVELLLPDVFVRRKADGDWQIELNPETMPRVLVNQDYYATLAGRCAGDKKRQGKQDDKGDDRTFLTECLASANWLTRSLEQRARTILKVAAEIVRQQEGFFLHGVTQLKPLTLKQVAEAIEMHESTVSRVTSHKSFGTDRGIFEMKFFFSAAISQADGSESQAAEAVRQRIRQLIEQENPDAVLSDDALVQKLKREKIDVARRTVAKYRESLKIPSSLDRRRMKKTVAPVRL